MSTWDVAARHDVTAGYRKLDGGTWSHARDMASSPSVAVPNQARVIQHHG